jgi:hypothetical protein
MPTNPARKPPVQRPTPAKPKPAPKPAATKKEIRQARHAGQLHAALLGLRATLQEIQEHYSVRTNGLLVQMMQILEPPPGTKEPLAIPSKHTIELMTEEIKGIKVKPKKGRGKDLQRIQELVEALWVMFPPQH